MPTVQEAEAAGKHLLHQTCAPDTLQWGLVLLRKARSRCPSKYIEKSPCAAARYLDIAYTVLPNQDDVQCFA